MRVGLFIPCYIDQFFPQVGMATVEVLSRFAEIEIDYPTEQTCCGQPMANTGCLDDTRPLAERFFIRFQALIVLLLHTRIGLFWMSGKTLHLIVGCLFAM